MVNQEKIIGIDEAGRGPLAGPVHVAAVVAPVQFDFSIFEGLTDSKLLSETVRQKLFSQLKETGEITFAVRYTKAVTIDKIGINDSISQALKRAIDTLAPHGKEDDAMVLLDGGLQAPERFTHQETIIKGDQKEPVISLASIAAKVARDTYITRQGDTYPNFQFAQHKGYGTKAHRAAISRCGPTNIHRHTYLQNIV